MLKPINKEVAVNESEKILATIASHTFFSLWCYPSLYRSTGKGKELADLTIFFNNSVILFSDKGHVTFQERNDIKLAWSRWYRAAVKESAKQLHGAESCIRNHPDKIFLNSKLDEPFPFDLGRADLKIHLVAVTRGIGKYAKQYFDAIKPGSRGSLGYLYRANEEQLLDKPFFVGDVDMNKTFVHVLDEGGIKLLLEELCTPADFIRYLEVKEDAVRNQDLLLSAGEEETLACYLQEDGGHGFGKITNPPHNKGNFLLIPEGEWDHYSKTVIYALRYQQRKEAKLWNEIISRFADGIVEAQVGEASDLPFTTHANAVQVLASENLLSSSLLAKALFDKFNTVPSGTRSARTTYSICNPGRVYVFVFFPWDHRFNSYEEYRQERTAYMQLYAHVARYKFQNAKEILILGADTKGHQGASETIFAIDASVPLTSDERATAQKIMKTYNIIDNISHKKTVCSGATKSISRNALCPCGSNKKYKKCCLNPET